MWKDFFYFTRSEKKAIILLSVLIVIMLVIRFGADSFIANGSSVKDKSKRDSLERIYSEFLAGITEKETNRASDSKEIFKTTANSTSLAAFDPNSADSVTLVRLGLPNWIARNILRYRAKGGKFRKPEDFRKMYGLTDEMYATLLPYISIRETPIPGKENILTETIIEAGQETFPKAFKYPKGTIIDLNEADTTELKKIPGIGSATARKIAGYRTQLGGFYDVSQLQDLDLDTAQFASWFTIGGYNISRINLNKVSVDRLRKHPYFNFYQAKAIVELRKKKGPLKSLDELILFEEFEQEDFERMKYYTCFE